jgi:hypothetical protein
LASPAGACSAGCLVVEPGEKCRGVRVTRQDDPWPMAT